MQNPGIKIQLTDFEDIKSVTREIKKRGATDKQLYHQIVESVPVDLDILARVIYEERASQPGQANS